MLPRFAFALVNLQELKAALGLLGFHFFAKERNAMREWPPGEHKRLACCRRNSFEE
jgi:hypothetical protein